MKTALKIIGISLAALAVAGGAIYAAAQALEETDTHNDTISRDVDRVVIKAEAGDIEVVRGGRSVQIERTDHYVIESPDVSQELEDGVLTIDAECDSVPLCTTDYRVQVPKGVSVDVRTYVGDVNIEATRKAEVDARTYVGDIDVEVPQSGYDVASLVDADTEVGDVDVTAR